MRIERLTRVVHLRDPKLEVAEDSISQMKGTQNEQQNILRQSSFRDPSNIPDRQSNRG